MSFNAKDGRRYNVGNGRIFINGGRSKKRADNILGVVQDGGIPGNKVKRYRKESLQTIEDYMTGCQYQGKMDWDQACGCEDYVPLKDRKPKIIYPFGKVFTDRISSKLLGASTFPKFKFQDDPDTEYFLGLIISETFFQAKMLDAIKKMVAKNAVFVRFKLVEGSLQIEKYDPNNCWPEFHPNGDLSLMKIRYVYQTEELDDSGRKIERWFQLILTENSDILFDNPIFNENSEPEFEIVQQVEHGLGFVQGEWFSRGESNNSPDGDESPFLEDMFDFIDAINYNLSQSDTATRYGMDPQLMISGMDEESLDTLIKSSAKAWALGKEGKAEFAEVSGSGVETGMKMREDFYKKCQDIARIVFLDPEKAVGSAQSGKAMEVLHGPLVELVNEFRPWVEKGMKKLLVKIMSAILYYNNNDFETDFITPPDYAPKAMDFKCLWPPVFELTAQDKQQLVSICLQATNGNIIARDTGLRWLQSQGVDFGVEDLEAEQDKINNQKNFNSFF